MNSIKLMSSYCIKKEFKNNQSLMQSIYLKLMCDVLDNFGKISFPNEDYEINWHFEEQEAGYVDGFAELTFVMIVQNEHDAFKEIEY